MSNSGPIQEPMATDATLDPPGSIVILGTTPLGIEAALYGRYLGYDVRLLAGVDAWIERNGWAERESSADAEPVPKRIGPRLRGDWWERHWLGDRTPATLWDEPMPMLPDRCLSPLSMAALEAQRGGRDPWTLPITMRQWVQDALWPLTQTDLLAGRVFPDTFVEAARLVDVEQAAGEPDEEVPPDFELRLTGEAVELAGVDGPVGVNGPVGVDGQMLRCEALFVAEISEEAIDWQFGRPVDYLFDLTPPDQPQAEAWLREGWRRIAAVYAGLAGRADLDLYRPVRGSGGGPSPH